jgi:molecular chaperone GrpE
VSEQPERDMADRLPPPPAPEPAQPDGQGETVAALRARVAELEDSWRRALADLDNLRKRVARDAAQQQVVERARTAREWLPVVDNLDLALDHAATSPDAIVQGVQAVREQALSILARLGFPRRDDTGTRFDPARHEAVAAVPHEAPEGTVVQVVRPAYGDGEHQLRPASVVVSARPPG